jgi:ribosomal protein S18 acetylase RimI-like enzyme
MGLRVRVRQPSDLRACVDLLWRVHQRDSYPARWPDEPGAWLAPSRQERAWVAIGTDRAVTAHVAVSGLLGHPMSEICVGATGLPEQALAVLSRLVVDPDVRGRGVARALVQAVENHARSEGRRLVLDVGQSNAAAVAIYEHLGWQRIGELGQGPARAIPVYVYAGPPVS